MALLVKGQNAPLTADSLVISLGGTGAADLSALLVTANGTVRSDADFVFFNQPAGPGVRLVPGHPGQCASLVVQLSAVPADIHRVRAVITLDDSTSNFGRFAPPVARVSDLRGSVVHEYRIEGLSSETVVIALELYRRQREWKIRAVGQGYEGGFADLVTDHGITVDEMPVRPTPSSAPTPERNETPRPVSLGKVVLDKATPTVKLAKVGDGQGVMRVNLNWSTGAAPQGKGFFASFKRPVTEGVDLDLAAMYELADGTVGVIQALGNTFGDLYRPPYIKLDGDDRSGANASGENLHINLADISKFRRILIFTYIYEGALSWASADGVITLYPTSGRQIEVRLDSGDDQAVSCAIAMLTNTGSEMTVTHEVNYIRGNQDAVDNAYGFGMRWTPGSK